MRNFLILADNIASKCFSWLLKGNRWKNFIWGFFIGGIAGLIPVIVAAFSVEYKNWQWCSLKERCPIFEWTKKNGFDWLNLAATLLGGIVICTISVLEMGHDFNFLTGIF